MGKYSINVLAQLSDIKAHTIRIWEKRYNLFDPDRTSTNIRYYNDEQLRKLLNITILYENGLKISNIAKLSDNELFRKAGELSQAQNNEKTEIAKLVIGMMSFNEAQFSEIIHQAYQKFGVWRTFAEVIYPFLHRVGILWMTDSISTTHEHFVSNIIRAKLLQESIPATGNARPRNFLLFLPEGEWHELGLLFYNYLIRNRGHRVIYLGQSLPLSDIEAVIKRFPDIELFGLTTVKMLAGDFRRMLEELVERYPNQRIYFAGKQIATFKGKVPKNLIRISEPNDLLRHIK